jgi:hypothetical protein
MARWSSPRLTAVNDRVEEGHRIEWLPQKLHVSEVASDLLRTKATSGNYDNGDIL